MLYHIYEHEGQQYHCGCQPQSRPGLLKAYAATRPGYSLAEIAAAIEAGKGSLATWVWTILDQGQRGDCWDYAALNAMMTKLNLLYGEKVLLDASIAVIITGQYNGGAIDSAISEVQSIYGIPTAEFMGTDPTVAKINLRKASWPKGWEENAKLRIVPAGEWVQTHSPEELASAIIDGNPGVVGVSWQGGGHALEIAEVKTAAQLNEHIEVMAAASAFRDESYDALLRARDSLVLDSEYRDPETGKLQLAGPAVLDLGSTSDLLAAGPNSWSPNWASGWGSYPGRPGWWLLSMSSSAMRTTFSSNGFGSYALCGVKDSAVEAAPSV